VVRGEAHLEVILRGGTHDLPEGSTARDASCAAPGPVRVRKQR